MKREKHVFSSHSGAAKAYAEQRVGWGRSSALHFRGVSSYSYGEHFEISKIIGPKLALITLNRYGSCTSRHISEVSWALKNQGYELLSVAPAASGSRQIVETDHKKNLDYYLQQAEEQLDNGRTATKQWAMHTSMCGHWLDRAQEYIKFLGCPDPAYPKRIAQLEKRRKTPQDRELMKKLIHTKAKATRKANIILAVTWRKELEDWRCHREWRFPYYNIPECRGKTYLRLGLGGGIETSAGDNIGRLGSIRMLRAIRNKETGFRLFWHQLSSVDSKYARIGRWNMPMSEIAYIEQELGM